MSNNDLPFMEKQQKELEELALSKGAERFVRGLYGELDEEAREAGIAHRSRQEVSRTQPGKRLIVDYVDKVTQRLREHFTRVNKKAMGRSAVNINPFLFAESLEGVAFLALKTIIDFYYRSMTHNETSEALRTKIINTLGNEILLELYVHKARKEPSDEFSAMEKAIANSKNDNRKQKEYLRRRMRLLKKRMEEVDFKNDPILPFRIGAVIYGIFLKEGIIKIRREPSHKGKNLNPVMCRLAPSIAAELRTRLDRWIDDHPVWGPMVLPPLPWKQCDDGGYHFKLKNALSLVKNGDKSIEKENCPEVFNAVNCLQSTSYCINQKILEIAQTVFKKKDQYEYKFLFKIPTNTNPSESMKIKSSLLPTAVPKQLE